MLRVCAAVLLVFFVGALVPRAAFAHEVYVLPHHVVEHDIATISPNPFLAFNTNQMRFLFWGFVVLLTIATVFCISVFHSVEQRLGPLFGRLKRYAPLVTRLTLGSCLIACAYYQGLFGPDLPLSDFLRLAGPMQWGLYATGFLVLVGLWTRYAALVALGIFCIGIVRDGTYLLTYANYLGEILITLILGGGAWSLDHWRGHRGATTRLVRSLEPYAFLIARICFGTAIVFAAFYAKFLHSNLALDTIATYHLTTYFPFEPLFIVLGALIIESLIGIFIILGVEVRWTALFFLFWLGLSLCYFGEAVWPHLVLLGLNVALIFHGYDRYTLEGRFFKKHAHEPVL